MTDLPDAKEPSLAIVGATRILLEIDPAGRIPTPRYFTPELQRGQRRMPLGYLCLVLHAHLPFVRHPEDDDFLEEDWLYEAITETYVPLLEVFDGLERDGVDWRMTMSVTPTLAAMLSDPLLQYRYVRHLDNLIALTNKE